MYAASAVRIPDSGDAERLGECDKNFGYFAIQLHTLGEFRNQRNQWSYISGGEKNGTVIFRAFGMNIDNRG